jgi:diguanylate cyclase (GGDEF)-like protein
VSQVLIIHHDPAFSQRLVEAFERVHLIPTLCESTQRAMGLILTEPPDVIVVEAALEDWEALRLCETLRRDNAFANVATIALLPSREAASQAGVNWCDTPFDDYLLDPVSLSELIDRIQICVCRGQRYLDANPLTRLPGNNAIIRELERRMVSGEEFAVAHVDLDNFKAFNDKYGFSRGDEALRLTARLLQSTVGALGVGRGFIGHIGGDDFVFIVPIDRAAEIGGRIVDNFDRIITSLYDEEDRERGFIVSTNRRGQVEEFALMSISIAIVPNHGSRLRHLGQISSIAAELKKKAKAIEGSAVVIDRRGPEAGP